MTSSRPTVSHRASRVHFNDEISHLPPVRLTFRNPWIPSSHVDSENFEGRSSGRLASHVPIRSTAQNGTPTEADDRDRRGSDDTLIGDEDPAHEVSKDKFTPRPSMSPHHRQRRHSEHRSSRCDNCTPRPSAECAQPLRSALRRSISEVSGLSDVQENSLGHRGFLSNLIALNGMNSRSRATGFDNGHDIESGRPRLGLRYRGDSVISTGSAFLDEDDPRVTGYEEVLKRRRVLKNSADAFNPEKKPKGLREDNRSDIIYNMTDIIQRQTFIIRLARALMLFGSPSHRIESQLVSASRYLELDAQFVHMPSVVICSFGDVGTKTSETHFIKANGRLMLGKLHSVHGIYRSVVHGQMDAQEGCVEISKLLRSPPLYGVQFRCFLAFVCCFLICPLAFRGSLADASVSGLGGAILAFLQLVAAHKNAMYADVFEISIAVIMSFAARALTAVPGHVFCYQAVSSSAVVLILPGYLILCSSLELASKNMLAGSVRMVYAIIYSLFLGFGLTIGSDLAYIVFPALRRAQAAAHNLSLITLHGSFSFANVSHAVGLSNPEDLLEGCYRSPHSVFLLKSFPLWTMFILVPAYSFASSLWNLQPVRSKQLPVMVFISCASYAANKAANHYIFNRSDVVSAIGAFVVGLLGNMYSRLCGGTAFQVMSVAVCFLIPSGIAATGGLSQNYNGMNGDAYSAGLSIGLRMVQVGIGITVGLFTSGLFVYSFGPRKKNALFAF